ncbi:hypothetical protein B7494_g430 [Chlorociboria aeruginascens]|nr:hypothetical protein B7494_g430 [Chlorociboria aeruginascens]
MRRRICRNIEGFRPDYSQSKQEFLANSKLCGKNRKLFGSIRYALRSLGQYGEMTTLRMGSKTWILLNSNRTATEIITRRNKITHERPEMPIASDLVSNGKRTVVRRTEEWREGRKIMQQLLMGPNLRVYAKMQEIQSHELLRSYLQNPRDWSPHNYRYATAVLHRVVTGYPLEKSREELEDFQRVTMEFIASMNQSVIDFFPQLAKLPKWLQPWRKYWATMGAFHLKVFHRWFDRTQEAVAAGTAPPSFIRDVLLHPDHKYKGDNTEALYLATSVMAAGGDNTRMVINTFIMALIANPEVIPRARIDLDKLCGDAERLPNMDDLNSLPYIAAIIKEGIRWRTTVPMIPQHESVEDIEFDGYYFPAGTNFVVNSIAVFEEFDRPDEFIPERWMNKENSELNALTDFWGFGGGRRVCVGYKVAQQALFIAYARLIYCFDIEPAGPFDSRVLNHGHPAEPFPVKITARSPRHQRLVEQTDPALHDGA